MLMWTIDILVVFGYTYTAWPERCKTTQLMNKTGKPNFGLPPQN